MSVIHVPPTVGHTLHGTSSCRAGGSHHMHGGVALPVLAIAIRVPLPDSSPSPSRLRIAAESVTAHLVDSVQNALRAVNDDGVGHTLGVVRHERACSVAQVIVGSVLSRFKRVASETPQSGDAPRTVTCPRSSRGREGEPWLSCCSARRGSELYPYYSLPIRRRSGG